MSDKVNYYDHLDQGDAATLGYHPDHRTPAEIAMAREEHEDEEPAGLSLAWVLELFLEMIFCDAQPMDWRFAGRRGLALLKTFSPGLLAGRRMDEALAFARITSSGRFPQEGLMAAAQDDEELLRDRVGALLRWVYQEPGLRWMERGTWRLYVLASHYHGRVLVRWEEAKLVRRPGKNQGPNGALRSDGMLLPGRYRTMSYADFAEAFGEGKGSAARARWCYRAKQILDGLPQVPGATSPEARARMSAAASGNGNRKGTGKQRSSC